MSIVIALGVTTPETSYSDMAAGSDPESVEASPAVNEKSYNSPSCGSAQSHGHRGLPYAMQQSSVVCCQDHNYGAPPPPTPPASPLSHTIIPRMELNGGVARGQRFRRRPGTEDNSADSDSSSSGREDIWNHCQCLMSPEGFIKCANCRIRDSRLGYDGQHRKPENVSAGESSGTESGDEEVSLPTVSYTATQHTPTSITLTVNRIKNKPKKRKRAVEKARGSPKAKKVKAFREGSRKSMRMKNSTSEAPVLDENTAEGWETKIRQWTDQYDEALDNQYSDDVQMLLGSCCTEASGALTKTESVDAATAQQADDNTAAETTATQLSGDPDSTKLTELSTQMQLQLGRVTRVQKHRKILRATKSLESGTLIIEYRGEVMLKQQFEVNGHFFKKPYPFVLFYSKFNQVEMCVDAREFGNDARFIRRSCTPNAEVRHVLAEGTLHLCVYALGQIAKDAEVTIEFDYEFNSCAYKVDCACHKGNLNCPVQKHNRIPSENPSSPPTATSMTGAETRQRKARKKDQGDGPAGGATSDDSNQPNEAREPHAASDTEDGLLDEVKLEAEEGEVDENGIISSSRKAFDGSEKRRKAIGSDDLKEDCVEPTDGAGTPSGGTRPGVNSGGISISTRRATYVMEPPPNEPEKAPSSSAPGLAAPPKPPPARSSKPRPKSRISRYRSSSSQRARRQRQALAQQAAATAAAATAAATVDQVPPPDDEGLHGPFNTELSMGECGLGAGHLLEPEVCLHRGNIRYPKTKKYLVTEWLNDKAPSVEKLQQEVPVERPLRITTDPTVLATTLNMLPGLSHSSYICTTPKHYVRFGSPFNPERCRPRPLQMDGTYGCFKKRWIKQAEDESCSASLEDCSESTSSHQSTSSRSTPNPVSQELQAPIKKRRSKYTSVPLAMDLPRPLSPITPPLPGDPIHPMLGLPYGARLLPNCLGFSPLLTPSVLGYSPSLPPNGLCYSHSVLPSILGYSPSLPPSGMGYSPSLPTSRCNTPLQFENISSPEASPAHRPESVSPEPCLRSDYDGPPFHDLSMHSSLGSPAPATEDFSLPGAHLGKESQVPAPASCPPSDPAPPPGREQAFRTEFNLIYTCSPLNANLGAPPPAGDQCFSPAEPFCGGLSGQGPQGDAGPACMSPYSEPHYSTGYPDSGTPPHPSNPPTKKKVSLLEYRKRKLGSGQDSDLGGSSSSPSSSSSSSSSSLAVVLGNQAGLHYSQDPYHHHQSHHLHHQLQPPASPRSSFSSSSSTPYIEAISPPLAAQDSSGYWTVPTSVERLRESQGPLERLREDMGPLERLRESQGPLECLREGQGPLEHLREGQGTLVHLREGQGPLEHLREGQGLLEHLREGQGPLDRLREEQGSLDRLREGQGPLERLREGQGPLERLREGHGPLEHLREGQGPLERGGIKMEGILKQRDGDQELGGYDLQQQQPVCMVSPASSPPHCTTSGFPQQVDSPSFQQQSSLSPFPSSYSPPPGQSFYSRLSQAPSPYPAHHHLPSSDPRPAGGALHQQSSHSSSSHLKASLLSSSSGAAGSPTPGSRGPGQAQTDLASQACRLSQQQQQQQGALQAGTRLLSPPSGASHYPPRHGATPSLAHFQHPLQQQQGSGVRAQSGSF